MNDVIVSMKDICKTFPGVKALDHVQFELRSGEVMALLGESGAGNMFLGREKHRGILLSDKEMEEAARILGDLKIDLDPRQTVGSLPVSKQQMVEIAKALFTTPES